MKIKTGDTIKVTAGKSLGKTGKVKSVSPKEGTVIVENINLYKRHMKPRQTGGAGKIVEKERALPVGNVALVCPHCKKPTRVGYVIDQAGQKLRQCRKCQEVIKE